jgi:hypothetical protein
MAAAYSPWKPMRAMRIKRHKMSHIVELSDRSVWHIWPGDLATTLGWLPTTDIEIIKIHHEICSHALIDCSDGSLVKVSRVDTEWPVDVVRRLLSQSDQPTPE